MLPFPSNYREAIIYLQQERGFILELIKNKFEDIEGLTGINKQSRLLDYISSKSQSMLIHKGDVSNISICLSTNNKEHIIQFPGKTLLFSVHEEFKIIKHTTNVENNRIVDNETLTVSKDNSVLIDGDIHAYTFLSNNVLVGNLSFPERKDINIFDLSTRKKKYWFPTDSSVARALFTIKAMEELSSIRLLDVAKEYVYHYHPAVAWAAFRVIYRLDYSQREKYKKLILKSGNERTRQLVDEYYK